MYGFTVKVHGPFAAVLGKLNDALMQEGFGVLTTIDVKATLKSKLGLEKRPYVILGACNPELARRALEAEPDIGLLLPCNVVVREDDDGEIVVGFMDPATVLGLVGRPDMEELGREVRTRLERVRDTLA